MRFFFYGTLLDHDVASLVLGRRLPPNAYVPAALPGHARRRVRGLPDLRPPQLSPWLSGPSLEQQWLCPYRLNPR